MMLAVSILLAWTISSPDISEFFKIPDWCPSAVPSAMTFGSSDNYVESWSNDVSTARWSVFRYEEDVTEHLSGQPTWDAARRQWNVGNALDARHHTQHIVYGEEAVDIDLAPDSNADPEYVGSSKTDVYLSWSATRQFYNIITWDYEWIDDVWYTAYSDGLMTNSSVLVYAPKASRLTPQWMAATYAPFAAFCERSYFFSEGQESRWDAGTWGPAEPLTDFSFAAQRPAYNLPPFQPDTNRTVRSRRLVEYDNLRKLESTITDFFPFDSLILERPGWQGFGTILFGSSVIENAYPDFKELPEFEWRDDPENVMSSNEWRHCAVTFDDFPDNLGDGFDRFNGSWYRIPRIAFDVMNYGEAPFWDWSGMIEKGLSDDKAVPNDYPLECVMTNFFKIGTNSVFRYEGGSSRRLDMNDVARMDQILAALDVTYNRVEAEYYAPCESGSAYAEASFALRLATFDNIVWRPDVESGFYAGIGEDHYLYIDHLAERSYTNVITYGTATYPYVAVTPSGSTYDLTTTWCDGNGDVAWVTADDFKTGLSQLFEGLSNGNYKTSVQSAWVGGTTFSILAQIEGGPEFPVVYASTTLADSVTVDTALNVSRAYTWERSKDCGFGEFHGVFHPGKEGWSRAAVKLWTMLSYMSKAGDENYEVWLADDIYDSILTKSTMYMAEFDDVSDLTSTTNAMSGKIGKLHAKMDEAMRGMIASYDDPASVIPIETSDVEDMCAHAKYPADGTRLSAHGIPFYPLRYMSHGDMVITNKTREADFSIETHDVTVKVATNDVVVSTTNFVTSVTNDWEMTATNYVVVTVRTNDITVVESGKVIVDEEHKINVKVTYNDEELWSTNDVTHASTTNDLGTVYVKSTNYVTVVTNDVWISITPGEDDSSATTNVSMRVTTDECTISVWTNDYGVATNYTVTTRTDNVRIESFTTNIEYAVTNYISGQLEISETVVSVTDGAVTSVKIILPDGTEFEQHGEMVLGSMGYSITPPVTDPDHVPTWKEEHGAMCYGKFNFWTKVKWIWNALRLNSD